jgi:polyhydroxybutyrate depolymerase
MLSNVPASTLLSTVTHLLPGDYECALEADGRARKFLVHVPPRYDGRTPTPVVLAFHGRGSNAWLMDRFCGLTEKSDAAGFLLVYPNGAGMFERVAAWNAGNCCGYAQEHDIDDVAFVAALLDDLARFANVDAGRIFATGLSNGAQFCYRLADELAGRIAAIAPVVGTMGRETCSPQRPVSILHFHGTDDQFSPFAGGVGAKSFSGTNFLSVQHTLQAWLKANGIENRPITRDLPTPPSAELTATRTDYPPGREGVEVSLITIDQAGHTWPGLESPLPVLGKCALDVNANDLMWEFFEKHGRTSDLPEHHA